MMRFKEFMSEAKGKRWKKKKSTKRAVRIRNSGDATRDSMRAGRRLYGQGAGK